MIDRKAARAARIRKAEAAAKVEGVAQGLRLVSALEHLAFVVPRTAAAAREAIGGLSSPSKMPGLAYGIPATECVLGSLLRQREGSACGSCYALKGAYRWRPTLVAQWRRMTVLRAALRDAVVGERFAQVFAGAIGRQKVFRWHDSGDLQNDAHFRLVCRVAQLRPDVRFWIPTREVGIIRRAAAAGVDVPENLTVRVSAMYIGQRAAAGLPAWVVTSEIHPKNGAPLEGAVACTAPAQGGKCGTCRACWDRTVSRVSYRRH